ncbi:MAG: acyltransferase [Bdellovibrionales bacterium]|nr:acyltransferase [Bdellovibrionales bacterium]
MSTAPTAVKPKTLLGKAWRLLLSRPSHLRSAARQYLLFQWAAFWRGIFPPQGVELGENVRIQRNGRLVAEAPGARIAVGRDSIIYENASVSAYGNSRVVIGEGSVLGDIRVESKVGIRIGKRFLSSWNVFIQDYDPHPVDPVLRRKQMEELVDGFRPRLGAAAAREQGRPLSALWAFPGAEVVIGDDVWVGANCTILKGARIGNGCIVGTGSVVSRGEYPDRSIIAGNPAKIVKTLPSGEVSP